MLRKGMAEKTLLSIIRGFVQRRREAVLAGTLVTALAGCDLIYSYNAQVNQDSAKPDIGFSDTYRPDGAGADGNADGVAGPWYLGVPDVYNLKAVYVGSDYSVNNKNLVDDFRILRNTNDNIYGISQLTIKESSSLTLTTADRLLVKFDYFAIDRSAGIGFFSNDSYPISATEDPNEAGKVATAQIPRFASTTNRETYNLRDSIDFRATVTTSATPNATVGSAPENPTNSTTLNVDSDGSYVPVPEQSFQADIEYYLPRVDRVVIGKDGKKK